MPYAEALRIQSMQHARKRNSLTHVLQAADPRHGSFNAHAEAGVRNAAVLAEIKIPLERFLGQIVFMNALKQQVVRGHALRSADDLAITFRSKNINAKREFGALGIGLHIERLHASRIAMHHDGPVIEGRKISFIGRTEVPAPFEFVFEFAKCVAFLQFLNGLVVGDSRKGRIDLLQLRKVAADGLQVGTPPLQTALNQERQQAFRKFHQIVERPVGDFRFHHPEFGKVTASLRFFRTESWTERIDLAQRHGCSFNIELPRLREIRLLFEVVDGKKRRSPFAGSGRQNRRIGESESIAVKEVASGANDFGAHPQNGRLALRAQPKMAMFHQEINTVFFGSDGIRVSFRDALQDLDARNVKLVAARGAFIGAHLALDDDAGFLSEAFDGLEDFGRDGILRHHSLNNAGAVTKLREEELAALSKVVKPSADGNGLAFVLADFCDGADRHKRLEVRG